MPNQNLSSYRFPKLEGHATTAGTPSDLLAEARAEAEELRVRAYTEGSAAGHAEGLARAGAEAASSLQAAAGALSAIAATREELTEHLTRQAGELALLVAEQIVAGAFGAQPERVIDVARAALRRLSERHRVTVVVNPGDLEIISDAAQQLQSELGGIDHVDVQADRRIERGGVIARTEFGEIDASIAAQLLTARELVQAALDGDAQRGADNGV